MTCRHACAAPLRFPRDIDNRPGLSHIDYSLGAYAEIREYLLARLNLATPRPQWAAERPHERGARALAALMPDLGGATSQPLLAWTHRHADDPGIALLEAAALVGDVLTFYQTLYANEAYLRTAQWRESIADLVRLLGYRLAPGLGGLARFALAVKGERPVRVPRGFALKAQLEGGGPPALFETARELTAYAHLGRFALYRPLRTPALANGMQVLALTAPLPAGALRAGDRLFVGQARPLSSGGEQLTSFQVLVVDDTWDFFGTRLVGIKGALTGLPDGVAALRAYKLAASARHFGHTAPTEKVIVEPRGHTRQMATQFVLPLRSTLWLDGDVSAAVAGSAVLVQAQLRPQGAGPTGPWALVRHSKTVEPRSVSFGGQSGAATRLRLDRSLAITDGGVHYDTADIRTITAHLADGPAFTLTAEPVPVLAARGTQLDFLGTAAEAQALDGRALLFDYGGGRQRDAHAIDVAVGAAGSAAVTRLRRVTLDVEVAYADFPHAEPRVDVYGNIVDATQGKSEDEVVLGDGNAGLLFQSFELPKAPLTYLLDSGGDAGSTPELEIYVGGLRWTRVASLFGRGADEHIYIVRETGAGKSVVQFGDGKTGARLPSGKGNVTARYRTGSGALGGLDGDATPQPAKKLPNFDRAFLIGRVTGGAPPEAEAGARAAAPGTMQSLGRMVSLADYEAEALALPGVLKARATWSEDGAAPRIAVVVLSASEDPADAARTAEVLRGRHASRGMARHPLTVVQGHRQQVRLALDVGVAAGRRIDDVRRAILAALGATGEEANGIDSGVGVLSWQRRQFGEDIHGSQVVAAVQQVAGVVSVALTRLDGGERGRFVGGAARVALPVLLAQRNLRCAADRILVLAATDLVLQLAATTESQP